MTKTFLSKLKEEPAVYEIAQKSKNDKEPVATYVGMTGNSLERLSCHCHGVIQLGNGKTGISNIKNKIKTARDQGYMIMFRFRTLNSVEEAADYESYLLEHYDYAWNLKDNDKWKRRNVE